MTISFAGIKTTIQLSLLFRREWQDFPIRGDAVPQIFNQTNAFTQMQLSQIGFHGYRTPPLRLFSNSTQSG